MLTQVAGTTTLALQSGAAQLSRPASFLQQIKENLTEPVEVGIFNFFIFPPQYFPFLGPFVSQFLSTRPICCQKIPDHFQAIFNNTKHINS
ncbi:MAG: hypothetical protein MJZ42_00530 [Bacteroidales bacterium]|nr:hypothetical protein [Bacteroidales bacterium]